MATTLQQKLQLKTGQAVVIINPAQGYVEKLRADLKDNLLATEAKTNSEAVLVFVNSLAEAKELVPGGIRAVKPDGLLWVAYPKGSSKVKTDVNRDSLWEAVKANGLATGAADRAG